MLSFLWHDIYSRRSLSLTSVTINLFISFTDSHSILIVGQWIECVTLTRHCSI